jgi:REP element-mobilizing transposase RayT
MPYDPKKHHRRSIRLPGYDYTLSGVYFVTICVRSGECLLGEVVNEEMRLSGLGQIAHDSWAQVPMHFPDVSIDAFTIMPNHLHAIVVIQDVVKVMGDRGKGERTSPLQDVGDGDDACRGEGTAPLQGAGRGGVSPPSRRWRPVRLEVLPDRPQQRFGIDRLADPGVHVDILVGGKDSGVLGVGDGGNHHDGHVL